jgi:hypothetical protein
MRSSSGRVCRRNNDQEYGEMISGPFEIGHIFDLTKSGDRIQICKAIVDEFKLSHLVEDGLSNYLRLFSEQHWRTIYWDALVTVPPKYSLHIAGEISGKRVVIDAGNKSLITIDFIQLLQVAQWLCSLEAYRGFERLIRGFRNPTQVLATIFEVKVAHWCANRSATLSLEFSPPVEINGRVKFPDFAWNTEFGTIYCECKIVDGGASNEAAAIQRLSDLVEAVYKEYSPWPSDYRVDIVIDGARSNGIERRPKKAIADAKQYLTSSISRIPPVRDEEVAITIVPKTMPVPTRTLIARSGAATVGTDRVPLTSENLDFTITLPMGKYYLRKLTSHLRLAKRQLPGNCDGAVFLDMPANELIRLKIQDLIVLPEYRGAILVSLWTSDNLMHNTYTFERSIADRLMEEKM